MKKYAFPMLLLILLIPSMLVAFKFTMRSLYVFLILAALLNNKKTFFWITFPVLLFLPIAIFFYKTYHEPLGVTFWFITSGSTTKEALDYLRQYWAPLVSVYALYIPAILYLGKLQTGPIFSKPKWRWSPLIFLIVPLTYYRPQDTRDSFYNKMVYHFSGSFPMGFLFGYWTAAGDWKQLQEAKVSTENLNVQSSVDPQTPETYVFVIGESSRRDRHSLYGYSKPTNPLLQKQDLYLLTDLISLHPHTVASLPVMLVKNTGLGDRPSHKAGEPLPPSFLQVFSQAGFHTYWITNQATSNGSMNQIGFYSRTADFFKTFHIHDLNLPWAHDGELVTVLEDQLKDQYKKRFFVIHLQGSHYGFRNRYPADFQKFDDDYDNTILYTDWVVNSIIELLKSLPGESALTYVSDHGLMLGECNGKYTHFDIKQSYEVPFFIWMSPAKKKSLGANRLNQLKQNLDKKLTTLYIYESLIELGGLNYKNQEPELSVFTNSIIEKPRIVGTFSQPANYDTGSNDSECHLR